MKSYREFYVTVNSGGETRSVLDTYAEFKGYETIHVIEHKALEEIKAERDRCHNALEKLKQIANEETKYNCECGGETGSETSYEFIMCYAHQKLEIIKDVLPDNEADKKMYSGIIFYADEGAVVERLFMTEEEALAYERGAMDMRSECEAGLGSDDFNPIAECWTKHYSAKLNKAKG